MRFAVTQGLVGADGLDNLVADGEKRMQRRQGVLEHAGESAAPQLPQARVGDVEQVFAAISNASGDDATGRGRHQSQQGHGGD